MRGNRRVPDDPAGAEADVSHNAVSGPREEDDADRWIVIAATSFHELIEQGLQEMRCPFSRRLVPASFAAKPTSYRASRFPAFVANAATTGHLRG